MSAWRSFFSPFQFASLVFLISFIISLAALIAFAMNRHSGSTGIDAASIQKIRYENAYQKPAGDIQSSQP